MIVIVDYGAGNLRSVENAFKSIGQQTKLARAPKDLEEASAIVLPGVGAFGDGMQNLRKLNLVEVLGEKVIAGKIPFLGICLGLQFLAESSTEHGTHEGLGWLPGKIDLIKTISPQYRVPHIGWNEIDFQQSSPLFEELQEEPVFYFVHSFQFVPDKAHPDLVTATSEHGGRITAAVAKDNIHAVQFHPEKSQQAGLQLLRNFVKLS